MSLALNPTLPSVLFYIPHCVTSCAAEPSASDGNKNRGAYFRHYSAAKPWEEEEEEDDDDEDEQEEEEEEEEQQQEQRTGFICFQKRKSRGS